jgi:hypothetical protein
MLKWDVFGYYLYLPATVVYNDPGIESKDWYNQLHLKYKPSDTQYQVTPGTDNRLVIRYPSGMAVQWLPFFLSAHAVAEPLGFPADGLSPPYSWAILIGDLIYALIGLLFLRKVLLRFFSDHVTAFTLVLVTMGTNYWAQVASETIMPHSNLFTLTVIVLWCTIRWHETTEKRHAIGLGLILGLATISRPTEIIWLLVPLLWGISNKETFIAKCKLLRSKFSHVLLLAGSIFAVVLFQLSYWKFTSGNWIFYSYDAHFSFTDPFILESLFSYKKGLLLYTPIMIFAIAGFAVVLKRKSEIFWALLIFFCINCWVIMSWECWWYASCFSNRALVEMYPAMAVTLGFMLQYIAEIRNAIVKAISMTVVGLLLLLNLFQHWQYNHGLLDGERITEAFYWRMFLRTEITGEDRNLLEPDHWPADEQITDFSGLIKVQSYFIDFEKASDNLLQGIDTTSPRSGRYIQRLGINNQFSTAYSKLYDELTTKEFIRIRTKVWIRFDSTFTDANPPMIVFDYGSDGRSMKYKSYQVDFSTVKQGEWFLFTADFIPPLRLHSYDKFTTYVWNPSGVPLSLDDMEVEIYEPADSE